MMMYRIATASQTPTALATAIFESSMRYIPNATRIAANIPTEAASCAFHLNTTSVIINNRSGIAASPQ